ncbi:hypothetical protein [Lacticaseibacillus thailandensis]|nr:hypothetical protein [Lacticaseibacillus thailandensis]
MQVTEDMQRVLQQGMALLRTAMPVRILQLGRWQRRVQLDRHASPYLYPVSATTAIVMGTQTADTDQAWSTWQAVAATAPAIAHVDGLTAVNDGVRVQLALPETLLSDAFAAAGKAVQAAGYVAYRNGWYLRWAQRLQQRLPAMIQLLSPAAPPVTAGQVDFASLKRYQRTAPEPAIGATAGTVTLAGVQLAQRGILTVDVDLPASCLPDAAHLAALRDLGWLTLGLPDGADADLNASATTFFTGEDAQPAVLARLQGLGRVAPPASKTILRGFSGAAPQQQLFLRAAFVAGMSIEPLGDGLWSLGREPHHVLLTGNQLGLNPDAAVTLTSNRDALLHYLGVHGLVVPRGNTYRSAAAAESDFARSFGHKSIFVGSTQTGRGTAMPVPPTPERFAEVVRSLGHEIMVQLLAPGTIERCLVLDGQVLAVQAHDYAYVVGDGRHDVQTLLAVKRARRTAAGQATLNLDADVQAALARQNVTPETVVARGSQVYLGRNPAAFAAGEYWDDRDSLDSSYDAVAIRAAQAVGLRYCSVDLAVINGFMPYTDDQPELAQVVAVDPAPNLVSWLRPTIGTGVDLSRQVLQAAAQ